MIPFEDSKVAVGTNEVLTRHSLNRCLERLLSNDLYLVGLYRSQVSALDVKEYQSEQTYSYGDTVWFDSGSGPSGIYLLKCLIDDNPNNPKKAILDLSSYVNGLPFFDKYGWRNQNQQIPLSSDELGITNELYLETDQRFERHEETESISAGLRYHRFGQVSEDPDSEDYYGTKILSSDAMNADPTRPRVFYPYHTGRFTTDTILNGVYRKWDNGLLEMDLAFRLGYVERRDLGGYAVDVLSCNTLVLRPSGGSDSSLDRTNDADYFYTVADMDIFRRDGGRTSKVGTTWQCNRNDYVNVYHARLDFTGVMPQGFLDTNYMIFTSDTLSQRRDVGSKAANPGTNTLTFCGKSRRGVTAVYVTTPGYSTVSCDAGEVASDGCLLANAFTCHIVGRWK